MLGWIANHEFALIGIIFMLVIGPAIGNYACSVVYRLPRGQTPFERHPFCGHCNANLKPIDLFPILSWLMTRGKCRYCGGGIPIIYNVIELTCGAIFVAYFLKFGMGEQFLLYATYATFVTILAAIQWQQGWLSVTVFSYCVFPILILRAAMEHTIFSTIQGAFLMLLLGLLLHRVSPRRKESPFTVNWIWWMLLLGALVPMDRWALLMPMTIFVLLVPDRFRTILLTTLALVLPVIMQ